MYNVEVTKAASRRQKAINMMNDFGESDEVTTLITKLNYEPLQDPEERYEYVIFLFKLLNFWEVNLFLTIYLIETIMVTTTMSTVMVRHMILSLFFLLHDFTKKMKYYLKGIWIS